MCRKCANLSYESCNENKAYRYGDYQIIKKANKSIEMQNKLKKRTYKNKLTKKYRKALNLRRLITDEDINNAEINLWNQ
jgi:hypothetical protein